MQKKKRQPNTNFKFRSRNNYYFSNLNLDSFLQDVKSEVIAIKKLKRGTTLKFKIFKILNDPESLQYLKSINTFHQIKC